MRFRQKLDCKITDLDDNVIYEFKAGEQDQENITGSFMGSGNSNSSQYYQLITDDKLVSLAVKNKELIPYKFHVIVRRKRIKNKYLLVGASIRDRSIMNSLKSNFTTILSME